MDRAILISIFSFAFGILVSSFFFVPPVVGAFLVFIAAGILAGEKVWSGKIEKQVLFVALVLISFSFGSLRYAIKDFYEPIVPASDGVVASEPEQRDNATRFVFESDNGEKVLVSTGIYSSVQYGDRVKLRSNFTIPEPFDGFDYPAYLSKDDIYFVANFAKVEIISSGHGNPVKSALFKLKRSFTGRIKETFSEPYASLLAGLIVAGRDAMPKDILEEFRRAGIIHIVVLSGYNITIIADFLRRVFEKAFLSAGILRPRLASTVSIVGILLFVIMTGAQATVVRAGLMVLAVIAAKMLGRKYSAPRALILAGFVMLLENPKVLVFDPSFQLSFLATLALIYVVPVVEKYLKFITEIWDLRITIATTIGTQLTVLPLLIYSMGNFSLVSLPANVLVLLIIPYTMFLGFAAALLSYVSAFLALPLAYLAHLLLVWILFVSNFLGNMPFASVAVPHVSAWIIAFAYACLLFSIMYFKRRKTGGMVNAFRHTET
ncbi:MAG: hypothetical protein A3J09_02225 [Candidatus Zambryskibacteria bacterium RIFCSPLOWO2_02_FULL_51_21]|uniref:ComEC/Rec2-related protein domain-containing protein n=1 Tax=Candidatus Zambryskibacteria bacterium RIFCSPHIGHO2_02_FULL_43_37 TaxID=1802749 RepID=A0A1G2TGI2_9BACT|nr:MAG: hypothetical protein A2723_02225 [Candidatus Zambryskibacteria bacterium RIFCSPHIGHO2_01_FULL_52_18]OHA96390.1 MAG: hypothetical protein A3D49_00675 [Candidatus Zambryskibacteria bacterium RIFCSPHIGHO2_02_FULL_43_37]OHB07789.1 MAG: hypothetical protein A2944_00535 [Candidatus Zambryskibacteria bacterium RIFCSPLOWO2_01_FULL_52_12]OHB11350.1 MAG: hypothetical protein A3J09_02225 [Candidatus Zambryskibacteria bacterium RIFCSPLOWO2_02_FULL_51_21]